MIGPADGAPAGAGDRRDRRDRGDRRDLRWPPGRPRILVTEAWLANAGDAAIAVALDRLVRRLSPTAAVLHAAYQHREIGPLVPELAVVPPLEELLGTPWSPAAPELADAGPALVEGADLVVAQGGGYLVEGYHPIARLGALAEVTRRALPLALFGVTVEPFRGALARRLLREVLGAAAVVVVRDDASCRAAADLGAPDALLGTDLAIGLFPEPPGAVAPTPPREGVSVVLTDHHADVASRPARQELATAVLARVAARSEDEPIRLWSTVQGLPEAAGEDDEAVARVALDELPAHLAARVEVVGGYLTPERAIGVVAGSRALVTMRLHPALFAAGTGTPAGLVLGGQRPRVLAGTALGAWVTDGDDLAAVSLLVDRVLAEPCPARWRWEALASLRRRLDASVDALRQLVEHPRAV